MTSLGIRYGSTGDSLLQRPLAGRNSRSNNNNIHSLSFPKLAVATSSRRISTAATVAATAVHVSRSDSSVFEIESGVDLVPTEAFVDDEEYDRSSYDSLRVSETIDEWMRDSVAEIVKNIRQAPLLVQIYANGVVKTETAVEAENWRNVARERRSSPEGIILVEELREKMEVSGEEEEGTKAFGVLIQGKFKGRDRCKSACYLLKTCNVNGGMGPFCTHFCLMKVRSFSKSASSQLNDCWLLP